MNEFNIASNTQLGRIEMPDKVYKHENSYQMQNYSRSGEFIENLVTDNYIEFFKRWFNLGGIIDVLNDIDEYFSSEYNLGKYSQMMNDLTCPIIPIERSSYYSPVTWDETDIIVSPVVFNNPRNKETQSYNAILQGRNYSR